MKETITDANQSKWIEQWEAIVLKMGRFLCEDDWNSKRARALVRKADELILEASKMQSSEEISSSLRDLELLRNMIAKPITEERAAEILNLLLSSD